MPSAGKLVFFGDCSFEVCEHVYEPAEDSFFFAERLKVKAGARVLDMGTGTGILGVVAAKQAREVLSVDINPHAVRCAKRNAQLNEAVNTSFLQSDLFAPLRETEKFDLITFNAPYLPSEQGEEDTWLGRSWAGGPTGRKVINQFISQSPTYLERGGEVWLMQSNLANVEETVTEFSFFGLHASVVAKLDLPFFETLVLLRAVF